ncbi:MAG: TolC family protein [Ignavibacteriota bacterium]
MKLVATILAAAVLLPGQQSPAADEMNIAQAVEGALRNYPSIRVTEEQMNAAAAGIRLARTAYLPRIDGLAQVNRATRNTFYGLLLPQGVIPGVDGVKADKFGTVFDSGVGILVSWQPFDFGLRHANVAAAEALHDQTRAALNKTRYEISVAAADAFLTVIAARQTVEATRVAVESWQTLQRSIHALVNAQLRPGADESRVAAEMAMAQTQMAQAEQAVDVARAVLREFVGAESTLNTAKLLDPAPDSTEAPFDAARNPLAKEQTAAIAQQQKRLDALSRTYYPQFLVQGVASGRGTGLETDGSRLGGANGLAPTVPNLGVGFTVTFSAMDRFAIREQQAMQAANLRAQEAQYQTVAAKLRAQYDTAVAALVGAHRVAASTPVAVSSARTAVAQATARYQSGLAPIDDVAQARRLLVQAEIDDALAHLNVWRARLQVAAARGDIQPFLNEAVR